MLRRKFINRIVAIESYVSDNMPCFQGLAHSAGSLHCSDGAKLCENVEKEEKKTIFLGSAPNTIIFFMNFTVNIVFLFFIYDPKNQTKEMETKQKRLKLLFAIICNNLVKQKQMKRTHRGMIGLHLYSTSNSHQTHIKVKTKQCIHMRAKWRIAQYLRPTTATLLFQYSVHLSKMERTDRCLRRPLLHLRLQSWPNDDLPFLLLAAENKFLFRSELTNCAVYFHYFHEKKCF